MSSSSVRRVSRARAFLSWLFQDQRLVAVLGGVLVCFDLAFVLLHIVAAFLFPGNRMFYIDVDRSYAEIFQGIKYVVVAGLLCCVAARRRLWLLLLWVPVFAAFFLDDLYEGHERVGKYVARLLPIAGERAQDVGEVCALALGAVVVGGLVWLGYTRGSLLTRWIYRVMAALLVPLVLFGVGLDLLHSLVPEASAVADVLVLVEDGGEMLVVSGFVVVVARLIGPLPARAAP